jgi:small subunit ribosomal protein S16
MVTIRLSRFGAKQSPFYHIVVTDSRKPRNGKFLEQIGTYDPAKPMAQAVVDRARLQHWLGTGAQVSTSLKKVLREQAKAAPASA